MVIQLDRFYPDVDTNVLVDKGYVEEAMLWPFVQRALRWWVHGVRLSIASVKRMHARNNHRANQDSSWVDMVAKFVTQEADKKIEWG